MNKIQYPLLICILALISFARCTPDRSQTQEPFFPIWEYGKWGYINAEGKTMITPQYDWASPFYDGMSAVCRDSLWGFINAKGEEVIKPKFRRLHDHFANGVCKIWIPVSTDSGYAIFINKKGDSLFSAPDKYYYSDFSNERALVQISLDDTGYSFNDERAYASKTGGIAIHIGSRHGSNFSDGIANLWGDTVAQYIDTTGSIIASFPGMSGSSFHEGLAHVSDAERSFFIDKTGKPVITELNTTYRYSDFHCGRAAVYAPETRLYGYIDRTGETVIPIQYSDAENFSNGLAAFKHNDLVGFIDTLGNVQIEPLFDEIINGFNNGLCLVKKDNQWGYIDHQGKFVWREQTNVLYEKADLTRWALDTLEIKTPLLAAYFNIFENPPRMLSTPLPIGISLQIDTTDITVFFSKYRAHKMKLSNATTETLKILGADGNLNITQQALNEQGQWQDITSFGFLFCGNSFDYHKLPPQHQIIFPAVFFKGSYKTKIRFVFKVSHREPDRIIYSNTFEGTINREQFLKPTHDMFDVLYPMELRRHLYTMSL